MESVYDLILQGLPCYIAYGVPFIAIIRVQRTVLLRRRRTGVLWTESGVLNGGTASYRHHLLYLIQNN